jgi:hypothetical protein
VSYRKLARSVVDLHNRYGASIVSVKDCSDLLEEIFNLQLRVKEEAPLYEIENSHLTQREVRKAFWELKAEREWELDHGVVWTAIEEGSSFVGLGTLVPAEDRMPACTKYMVIGGKEDAGSGDE